MVRAPSLYLGGSWFESKRADMAHTHETLCYTAEVFIVYEDKVLLRMHDKHHFWCSVGGHIELGEDPNEAALREVKEEVGLDIELWKGTRRFEEDSSEKLRFRELVPPVAVNRHGVPPLHEHVTFVFFASTGKPDVVPEREEDEWRWCTKDNLAQMDLRPNIRAYAEAALDALASSDEDSE